MNWKFRCKPQDLLDMCMEADMNPPRFHTAADLGLNLRGGLDHVEVAKNGWSISFRDVCMNGHCCHITFFVPVAERSTRRGPAGGLGEHHGNPTE